MTILSKHVRGIALVAAVALPLGACSSEATQGGGAAITDAAPGTYEYARQCFRALGLQALTSGTGTPTSQDVMDRAKAVAITAGSAQGMSPADILTDLLRLTGAGSRKYQSMSESEQADFAKANQAFAGECLNAQH